MNKELGKLKHNNNKKIILAGRKKRKYLCMKKECTGVYTATDASGVLASEPDVDVTVLFARPLGSEPLPVACVSVGGGVGGAAPTAGT
jgi:hypothetical protein